MESPDPIPPMLTPRHEQLRDQLAQLELGLLDWMIEVPAAGHTEERLRIQLRRDLQALAARIAELIDPARRPPRP